jgi:hypothetical protein
MQQSADGLEKLCMSEYAERFAENDIDTAVLEGFLPKPGGAGPLIIQCQH